MKKAQGGLEMAIYGLMLAVMIWIAFTQMIGPASDASEDARQHTTDSGYAGLDCDNSSISDGQKGSCLVVDFGVPGWALSVVVIIIACIGLGVWKKKKSENN